MRRFFVSKESVGEGRVCVTGDLYRHMVKVLRLEAGAQVELTDDAGRQITGTVSEIGRDSLAVTIEKVEAVIMPADTPSITIYQGLPKGERLDFVLQKATELGAAQVVLFAAQRSVARVKGGELPIKMVRWQKIAREAARQSGRTSVPVISFAAGMADVCRLAGHEINLLLWEEERGSHLKEVIAGRPQPASIGVVIGPEGGLTSEEAAMAAANGMIPVSLGQRILRTETAALAILAVLQFQWGDLG